MQSLPCADPPTETCLLNTTANSKENTPVVINKPLTGAEVSSGLGLPSPERLSARFPCGAGVTLRGGRRIACRAAVVGDRRHVPPS